MKVVSCSPVFRQEFVTFPLHYPCPNSIILNLTFSIIWRQRSGLFKHYLWHLLLYHVKLCYAFGVREPSLTSIETRGKIVRFLAVQVRLSLSCCAVWTGSSLPEFQRAAVFKRGNDAFLQPSRWRQYVRLKRLWIPIRLYGVTTQKPNIDMFTALRTSCLTQFYVPYSLHLLIADGKTDGSRLWA
jgi:hypothetical protein